MAEDQFAVNVRTTVKSWTASTQTASTQLVPKKLQDRLNKLQARVQELETEHAKRRLRGT